MTSQTQSATVTGIGNTPMIRTPLTANPFNIGIFGIITGTVTWKIQYSGDSPEQAQDDPTRMTWFDHPTLNAKTANADGVQTEPCRAIRGVITSGTGTLTIEVDQAGSI